VCVSGYSGEQGFRGRVQAGPGAAAVHQAAAWRHGACAQTQGQGSRSSPCGVL